MQMLTEEIIEAKSYEVELKGTDVKSYVLLGKFGSSFAKLSEYDSHAVDL